MAGSAEQQAPDYIAVLRKSLLTGHNVTDYPAYGLPCVQLVNMLILREKQLLNKKRPPKDMFRVTAEIRSLHLKFAQFTDTVTNLVQDGRYSEVLQCFKDTMDNNRPCWQMVMMCLAAVVKGPHATKESATAGYTMLPQLLKDSNMLFYFLQTLKLTRPDCKSTGFGRGLKSGVRCWYYGLSPERLLLELWHRPHAYGWGHKDVLKLIHIKQDMLSLGSKVVLSSFFSSLEKTKAKFAAEKDAAIYLDYVDRLYNKGHEENLAHLRVEVLKELEQSRKCSLVRQQDKLLKDPQKLVSLLENLDSLGTTVASMDPCFVRTVTPSAAAPAAAAGAAADAAQSQSSDPAPPDELQKSACQALVRRLQQPDVVAEVPPFTLAIAANTMARRVRSYMTARTSSKWRGGQPLAQTPGRKKDIQSVVIPPHLQEPLDVYDDIIYKAAVARSIASSFPELVFVCEPSTEYAKYIDTVPGFNVHKQLKASQAIVLSMLTLCHTDAQDWSSRAVRLLDNDEVFMPFVFSRPGFANTVEDFERACYYQVSGANSLDQILQKCSEISKKQVVYFSLYPRDCYNLQVQEYFAKSPVNQTVSKVVLVSLNAQLDQPCRLAHSDLPLLLQVNGFHERSIDIIKSFLTDQY